MTGPQKDERPPKGPINSSVVTTPHRQPLQESTGHRPQEAHADLGLTDSDLIADMQGWTRDEP
jgi:hypothetical protein